MQFIIKIYAFRSHMHISYIYLCILNIIIYLQGHHKIYFFGFLGGFVESYDEAQNLLVLSTEFIIELVSLLLTLPAYIFTVS